MDWHKLIVILVFVGCFGGLLFLVAKEIEWRIVLNNLSSFVGIQLTPTSTVLQNFCKEYGGEYIAEPWGYSGIADVPLNKWRMRLRYDNEPWFNLVNLKAILVVLSLLRFFAVVASSSKSHFVAASSKKRTTKFEILHQNLNGFHFEIYPTSLYDEFLVTRLGMQDIVVGSQLLDDNFIIKSNNEKNVKQMLGNIKIQEALTQFDTIQIRFTKYEGDNHATNDLQVLSCVCKGHIKDPKI